MKTIAVVITCVAALCLASSGTGAPDVKPPARTLTPMDTAKAGEWLQRWEKNITADARNRYCDKALGEDIGWLMTPFLDGFYYGWLATRDAKWIDLLVDWTDSWVKRGVREPDGYVGWPRARAAGTDVDALNQFTADSLLGEAMVLRPVTLMSAEILKTPALKDRYGAKASAYLRLSEQTFEKWDKRGAWRQTKDGGMMTVVMPFGIDPKTGKWTAGYETRSAPGIGFSHPDNKANECARWLLALYDATKKPAYRDRAEKWFRLMASRMHLKEDGATYRIWNYWEPAGPWDYKPDGKTKHWVGVHPNAGYYELDTQGIVDAYEHGLVFTRADIDRLIATALAEKRYWSALAPYSPQIQKEFESSLKPDGWGGLGATPRYLWLQSRLRFHAP